MNGPCITNHPVHIPKPHFHKFPTFPVKTTEKVHARSVTNDDDDLMMIHIHYKII